jgi:hypothetical protein
MRSSDSDRVVFLGRGAQHRRLEVDLDFPPKALYLKRTFCVTANHDIYKMQGYHPDQLHYVELDPTPAMWEFVRARGLRPTSLEATAQWLKSLRIA